MNWAAMTTPSIQYNTIPILALIRIYLKSILTLSPHLLLGLSVGLLVILIHLFHFSFLSFYLTSLSAHVSFIGDRLILIKYRRSCVKHGLSYLVLGLLLIFSSIFVCSIFLIIKLIHFFFSFYLNSF